MKYIVLFSSLLLAACATGVAQFPPAPEMGTCPELKTVNDDALQSELLETVNKNYQTYYACEAKVEAWNEWYTKIKEEYDRIEQKSK